MRAGFLSESPDPVCFNNVALIGKNSFKKRHNRFARQLPFIQFCCSYFLWRITRGVIAANG
jgi:hypothetical protein